jgi:3-hydroxyisobutyryl-CoA hydrolase
VEIPKANHNSVKEVLDKNIESVNSQPPFSLQEQLPLINRLFSIDSKNVETILEQLQSNDSDFALKQLSILQKMSPTSLKLTFEQIKRDKQLDVKECLIIEYQMIQNIMKGHDFF